MTKNITGTFTTMGASNHSKHPREENDYYATDPLAITLLDKHGLLDKDINYWECACGGGNLSKELERLGYTVSKNSDLFDRGYGEIGIDFLECTNMFNGNIITNPPFTLLNEFIIKGLELAKNKLYIFGRIQTLETIGRWNKIFKDNKPSWVCPFVKRIKCYSSSHEIKSSAVCYAWFIWDNQRSDGDTRICWLI